MWIAALFTVIFLMTPLVVTVAALVRLVERLHPAAAQLVAALVRKLAGTRGLWPSLLTSIEVAAFATVVALVLGTLCAIALVRGRFPGRELIATFLSRR